MSTSPSLAPIWTPSSFPPRLFTGRNVSPDKSPQAPKRKTQQYKHWVCGLQLSSHAATGFFQKLQASSHCLCGSPSSLEDIIFFLMPIKRNV